MIKNFHAKNFFVTITFYFLVFCSLVFSQDPITGLNDHPHFKKQKLQNKESDRKRSLNPQSVITVLPHDGIHSRHSAPQTLFRYARCYYLILASEMNTSGFLSGENITSLGFKYKYGTDLSTTGMFKVYFENTSDNTNNKSINWNEAVASMTQVHSDSLTIQAADGTFDIPLNNFSAFAYSGGGIYVAFEYSNSMGPLATVSNVSWCNRALPAPIQISSQSDDSLRVIANGSSNLRPETRFGTTKLDIVNVGPIYAMGLVGIMPCPDTNTVRVVVNHLRELQDTILVTTTIKNITGPVKHSFTDIIISAAIENVVITHKYLKGNELSMDSIIVKAITSGEEITGNNTAVYLQNTTVNKWNHYISSMAPSGGTGLSVGTGDYVGKFHSACCVSICAMDLSFFAETGWGENPFKAVIYAADGPGGLPGTLLHSSPVLISPAAYTGIIQKSTYFLTTPVLICSGYYYAGYSQIEERILRVSYQIENPIRTGEFFYTTSAGSGNWNEFAEISPYRIDVAPRTYLSLNIKAFLQGFYNGAEMVPDTVKVIIKSQISPYYAVDSTSGVLNADGNGIFNFINVNSDSCYYFEITHRNHIRTFSHNLCEKLNGVPALYDFTTSDSKAFGNNMIQINISPPAFAIYAGDVNQDDIIDAGDLSLIDNDAFNSFSGYVNTDLNGDDFVDASDLSIADNNVFNGVMSVTP